ncbi:hypothetical protein UZS93_14035 [Escherichia coli]|nr:hypothetical protein [Escherichia coli]MDY8958417.1 hypothetical protein [Escherichia coli]MDY8997131.1 hypothetical protein [Escherichia coli]MDY9034220.1 hypothetical protein [Escherichia coli]
MKNAGKTMTTPTTKEQQKQILIDTANHVINRENTGPYSENLRELARIVLAAMDDEPVAWKWRLISLFDCAQIGPWRVCLAPLSLGKGEGCKTEAIPLYAAPPAPKNNDFIPKNLDKALGVVGVALPESKEEFNFQIERWIQRLIDRVIRYADEFKEQPTPTVPEEMNLARAQKEVGFNRYIKAGYVDGWNACRAAMLQSQSEQPQNAQQNIPENILGGNSPVTPDDWIAAVNRLLDSDGSRGFYHAIELAEARRELEQLLAAQQVGSVSN